jgi:cell division protein FtsN
VARDYKSRANPPRKKKTQIPGWVPFLAGLLVGVFGTGLAWLKLGSEGSAAATAPQAQQQSVQKKEQKKEQKKQESTAPKPRFDFYTILPEMEVVVSETEEEPRRKSDAAAAPLDAPRSYMLQMGSFRKYEDADRLKASLALLGIEAEIQKVNVNGGEVFHRVRSGPLTRREANKLRNRLRKKNINSLVMKNKG